MMIISVLYFMINPQLDLYDFSIDELSVSNIAHKRHIKNIPNSRQIGNLNLLVSQVLQPIRNKYGKTLVRSGFRTKRINKLVRGKHNSQHLCKGKNSAADIQFYKCGSKCLKYRFKWIVLYSKIKYDQIILYRTWIHISYNKTKQRGNAYRAYKYRKRYKFKRLDEKQLKRLK